LLPRIFLFGLVSASVLVTAGCATIAPRNVLPETSASQIELEGFHDIRFWGDASARDIRAIVMANESQAGAHLSPRLERHQQAANFLAISGGADDGAFGAGLLVGWSDAGTRPLFDLVTGVSSGALIAPFAFLGREMIISCAKFSRNTEGRIFSPTTCPVYSRERHWSTTRPWRN
jgi:hypothetical protein